jgi:hypothetical protein
METTSTITAFLDHSTLPSGDRASVLGVARAALRRDQGARVLVFEDQTGRPIDVDPREDAAAPAEAAEPPAPRGRPRLGVVSREVTLLPRHWEWLEAQPNGISAALRRLIDEARRAQPDEPRARQAREAAHRVMTAMGGDQPGYEEALRALFARDRDRFLRHLEPWPADLRAYAARLADPSF